MKNVALFGAGRIGRIHGSNIAALPGVKLKYVCDPFGDNAAQLAAQLGAQVGTPEQVFADASIEVVAVGAPTDTHSEPRPVRARSGKPASPA
jgi:myo-inositol 2-dehydrogenase / D-chiro-inositol 1-dehydrogenase